MQDPALTWHTTDPDFTPCFLQTALAWTPCVFLFVAAPFDLHNSYTSKYSDIPWGPLNIFRILVNLVLIAFSVSDLVVSSLLEGDQQHYDVHYVTPAVRLLTFVSFVLSLLATVNIVFSVQDSRGCACALPTSPWHCFLRIRVFLLAHHNAAIHSPVSLRDSSI